MAQQTAKTRWWLVRHAPVVGVAPGTVVGQMDVPADVGDRDRLNALARRLPAHARRIATPLKRSQQTLDALNAQAPVTPSDPAAGDVALEEAFLEQGFGAWSGLTWAQIDALAGDPGGAFWAAPATCRPPPSEKFCGESFADVCQRVARRMDDINADGVGGDIICVAHAGSVRAALAHALGLTPDQALAVAVDNTSLTRLDYVAPGSWRVVGVNMIC